MGIIFLENLVSVTQNNVIGINFAIMSGWSVSLLKDVLAALFKAVRPPKRTHEKLFCTFEQTHLSYKHSVLTKLGFL